MPAIEEAIATCSELEGARWYRPDPAPLSVLGLVHDAAYVRMVEESCLEGRLWMDGGDTSVCPESFLAARLAVGGACSMVDAVMRGQATVGFSLTRPPGHHACRARGMGFCLFNNVAVAARFAQEAYGIERVAIIDWDVHHGNGTQEIFYRDPRVLFCSVHQHPLYPGGGFVWESGEGEAAGTNVNIPVPAGADGSVYDEIFDFRLRPAVFAHRPDLILLSAGFDAHRLDPLGGVCLESADFFRLAGKIRSWADDLCCGRVVSVLEGGYSLRALAESAVAHLRGLIALPPPSPDSSRQRREQGAETADGRD